jgi:hypothetical protein
VMVASATLSPILGSFSSNRAIVFRLNYGCKNSDYFLFLIEFELFLDVVFFYFLI